MSEVVRRTSSTQFVDWCVFLQMKREEEQTRLFETVTPEHHYLAQIAAQLDAVLDSPWFRQKPRKAIPQDFLLTFEAKPVDPKQRRRRSRFKREKVKPRRMITSYEDTGITFDEKPPTKRQIAEGLASKAAWMRLHGLDPRDGTPVS